MLVDCYNCKRAQRKVLFSVSSFSFSLGVCDSVLATHKKRKKNNKRLERIRTERNDLTHTRSVITVSARHRFRFQHLLLGSGHFKSGKRVRPCVRVCVCICVCVPYKFRSPSESGCRRRRVFYEFRDFRHPASFVRSTAAFPFYFHSFADSVHTKQCFLCISIEAKSLQNSLCCVRAPWWPNVCVCVRVCAGPAQSFLFSAKFTRTKLFARTKIIAKKNFAQSLLTLCATIAHFFAFDWLTIEQPENTWDRYASDYA